MISKKILFIFQIIFFIVLFLNLNVINLNFNKSNLKSNVNDRIKGQSNKNDKTIQKESAARDLLRYECGDIRRIGKDIENAHPLYRIDGGWFVCFDKNLAPINQNCLILSFGIHGDYSFDEKFNQNFKCHVESFDPYVEADFFRQIRRTKSDDNSPTLIVNDKPLWRFHRIGIIGPSGVKNKNQIGWLATFDQILEYTKLENKIIDVLKMDIEEADFSAISSLNLDYICKYVKQFMIETHPTTYHYDYTLKMMNLMFKLEKCFLLFRRDTRFFMEHSADQFGSTKTEFQEPITFKLDLKHFSNEIELINYMITFGELYFINANFL